MSPAYKIHIVLVKELGHHFGTKCEADSSVILSPAHRVFVWIRPEQIAKEALIRHICRSHDTPDLFHRLEIRTQTTMAAEDLFINNGSHRQAVEAVCKRLPQFDVVAPLAFVIKAIDPIDGGTLMVAT